MPDAVQAACAGKLEVDISASAYLLLDLVCPQCKAAIGCSVLRLEAGNPKSKAFKCKACGASGTYKLEVSATYLLF